MKKLLSLFGAIGLTATSSSVAVACGSDRIASPVLNSDLARQIIAQLAGENIANIDFGDIFGEADVTATVVNIINDLIAKQFSYESTNNLLRNLGLKAFPDKDSNGKIPADFISNFEDSAATIAEDKLFTEYTKSISSSTRLDLSQLVSLYSLNPIKEIKGLVDLENKEFDVAVGDQIMINGKVWGLFIEGQDTVLPTINDLTASESPFTIKGHKISAKTALRLRFQDYFTNSLMKNIAENLLTMSYIDSSSFVAQEVENGYEPFINTNSPLFSKTQTWFTSNTTATGREWKTNVKMVWSFKFQNENNSNTKNALDLFNALSNKLNTSTGELNDNGSLMDLMNQVAEEMGTTLGGIYEGDDTNAYDSFFNMQGFKGLTLYESGTSIGTSPISSAAYEDGVKSATKAGMIKNGPLPYFTDSSNGNISEFVFVLPIYMIELLGGSDTSEEQSSVYNIEGADGETKNVNLGPSAINKNKYVEIWNQTNNLPYHSVDLQNLIKNQNVQTALINQIKYVVSQDATTTNLAKTALYSKYLDADDIFYAGLYNQIGTYIRNDEEDDE